MRASVAAAAIAAEGDRRANQALRSSRDECARARRASSAWPSPSRSSSWPPIIPPAPEARISSVDDAATRGRRESERARAAARRRRAASGTIATPAAVATRTPCTRWTVGPPAAHVVVVHARQIVVHERIRMHDLDGRGELACVAAFRRPFGRRRETATRAAAFRRPADCSAPRRPRSVRAWRRMSSQSVASARSMAARSAVHPAALALVTRFGRRTCRRPARSVAGPASRRGSTRRRRRAGARCPPRTAPAHERARCRLPARSRSPRAGRAALERHGADSVGVAGRRRAGTTPSRTMRSNAMPSWKAAADPRVAPSRPRATA